MEVPNNVNNMRLSPVLLAIFTVSAALGLSSPARGQTVPLISAEPVAQNSASSSGDVIVETVRTLAPISPPESLAQAPVDSPPETTNEPVSDEADTQQNVAPPDSVLPSAGTEATPQQETPDQIQFGVPSGEPLFPGTITTPSGETPSGETPSNGSASPDTPGSTNGTEAGPGLPQSSPPVSPGTPVAEEPRVLVAEVAVSGATGDLENEVYRAVETQAGRTTTRSQLQEDINAIFATGFFSNVRAVPEDTPLGVRVTFLVEPNPVLRRVQVEGSQVLPPAVVEDIFSEQYGTILNLRSFQSGIQELNQWYQDNGYVLAQVIDAPQVASDGTVTLEVAEGVIENIQVRFLDADGETTDDEGNPIEGKTRDFIITREFESEPGEVFNRRQIETDLQRVFGLGIFEDVRLSLNPGQDPRQVDVVVNVTERNTGSVAAGLGVSSASGLFGSLSYQEQNLGGNNQKLGAEVQLGQREFLFDVNFTDPWIAGDPYRTSYTVNLFNRRSRSLIFDGGEVEVTLPNGERPRIDRLGGGINFTRPLSDGWTVSLGTQYQRISVRDRDREISPVDELGNDLSFSGTGRDTLLTLQLAAVRDRRNNSQTPTSGSFLRIGTEQSIPIGAGSILLNRLRGSYSYYVPVQFLNFDEERPQTLAFNVQAGTVLGDLPPYEAFSLGGSNSVRGYDEGDLGAGRSFLQATAEYRFPIFSIVGGALFVDVGTDLGTGSSVIGDPAGVRGKPGSGFGYGIGLRVQSPLGPLRIDYGLNDQGDSRIHFGLGERF